MLIKHLLYFFLLLKILNLLFIMFVFHFLQLSGVSQFLKRQMMSGHWLKQISTYTLKNSGPNVVVESFKYYSSGLLAVWMNYDFHSHFSPHIIKYSILLVVQQFCQCIIRSLQNSFFFLIFSFMPNQNDT